MFQRLQYKLKEDKKNIWRIKSFDVMAQFYFYQRNLTHSKRVIRNEFKQGSLLKEYAQVAGSYLMNFPVKKKR